jgi:hypothetical protein
MKADYSPNPQLDAYIRRHLALYRRAMRRAMARHPNYQPRFLLGMAMQSCVARMFRRRMLNHEPEETADC